MANRRCPVRRKSRFPVSWLVLYGTNTFLGKEIVFDLTARGIKKKRCERSDSQRSSIRHVRR